jgi:hypothetical protein
MLTSSLPLSRSLDRPVCLARFPSARLWLKDESLEDSANLPSALPCKVPGFPRHTQSLGASRRKAGALPALDPDIIARRNRRRPPSRACPVRRNRCRLKEALISWSQPSVVQLS